MVEGEEPVARQLVMTQIVLHVQYVIVVRVKVELSRIVDFAKSFRN